MKNSLFDDTMVNMNWTDIRRHAAEDAIVLIPLGVVEEHGPHLCLGTDIYTAHRQCLAVRDRLAESGIAAILAPPFYWGVCQSTGGFPGSFLIRRETATALLYDLLASLDSFGFHQAVGINAHGDIEQHIAILEAFRTANESLSIHARYAFPQDRIQHYGLQGDEPFLCLVRPTEKAFGDASSPDMHGGDMETATMQAFYPEHTDSALAAALAPVVLPGDQVMTWLFGGHTAELSPNGYVGAPALFERVDVAAYLKDSAERISEAIHSPL